MKASSTDPDCTETHVGQGMKIRGRFNINIQNIKAAMKKSGREDREMIEK